jgi:hypothetical protein
MRRPKARGPRLIERATRGVFDLLAGEIDAKATSENSAVQSAGVRAGWAPTMEQRADLEARQVKCLIASAGHLWMKHYFDRLPPVVRGRLAESAFNICPACMDEEARRIARGSPTIATYFAVIETIERKLREEAS